MGIDNHENYWSGMYDKLSEKTNYSQPKQKTPSKLESMIGLLEKGLLSSQTVIDEIMDTKESDNSDMRNITSIRQYAKRVDDILSKPRNWMQQIQKHIDAMEKMDEDIDEFVREELQYTFNEALDNFNSCYESMERVARIAKELVGRPTPKNEQTLKEIEEKVNQKMKEMTADPVKTEVKGPKKKRLAQWHR